MSIKRTSNELDMKKPAQSGIEVKERETFYSDGALSELVKLGQRLEGADGKRYLGSVAIHIYGIGLGTGDLREYVTVSHITELTQIPEHVALEASKELGRALMKRYGHKPPRKRGDPGEGRETLL